MALTVNVIKRTKLMNEYAIIADVRFDSAYATGGESLTEVDLGLASALDSVITSTPSGYLVDYDHAAKKLKMYTAQNTEVINNTDLSAVTVRIIGMGI